VGGKMNKIIEKDSVSLRLLTEQDKPLLLKWLTDERILNFWEGKSTVYTFEKVIENYYSEEDVECIRAIIECDGKSIGYVHMYKLNEELLNEYEYPLTDKVVYGIDQFIGEPEYWDKGIGTKFMKLVLQYLTKEKNAEIIILDPHVDNPRAIHVYEKVGFKKIKFLPKHELHDGEMVDCYLMEYTK
jgi:aminoglycoside 2''-phosphotransferase